MTMCSSPSYVARGDRGLIRDRGTDGGFVLLCSYSLKKSLVSGSILVHAGALFSPHPHCRCQNDNTYSEGLHILKLYANGAYQSFVQIKPGTVISITNWVTSKNLCPAKCYKTMWTWSLSLNIQYQDSDPLHVTFVINVINIPRQQFLTVVNLAHQITIKQILR